MLGDISGAENIYLVCGYTDMRKSIDGLCAVVKETVRQDPRQNALFLFCGRQCDRIRIVRLIILRSIQLLISIRQ